MRMHRRIRLEKPDGREFRITSHTSRGKDVGYLLAALWNPEREDWEAQDLDREDVQLLHRFLTQWLGEDN